MVARGKTSSVYRHDAVRIFGLPPLIRRRTGVEQNDPLLLLHEWNMGVAEDDQIDAFIGKCASRPFRSRTAGTLVSMNDSDTDSVEHNHFTAAEPAVQLLAIAVSRHAMQRRKLCKLLSRFHRHPVSGMYDGVNLLQTIHQSVRQLISASRHMRVRDNSDSYHLLHTSFRHISSQAAEYFRHLLDPHPDQAA